MPSLATKIAMSMMSNSQRYKATLVTHLPNQGNTNLPKVYGQYAKVLRPLKFIGNKSGNHIQ